MNKTAETIQFDRERLLSLAEDLSYPCYKMMEAVRLEDLRLTCLDYDERIKGLEDEQEKEIERLRDAWESDIEKGEEKLREGRKLHVESGEIKTAYSKIKAENDRLKNTDWVKQCNLLTAFLSEAECKASILSKKNEELVKGQKTLQEKLKLSPGALAKKSKLIHENKTLYARVRELENELGLDPTE